MGSRGPAPTPSKVLLLRGTFRSDRHGDPAAEVDFAPLAQVPPPPGFLDRVGKFEWQRVGAQLVAQELLTEGDLAAFTLYCVSVSRVAACEKIIKKQGLTMVSPQGVKARPEVAIGRQAAAEARKFAQEFGLTPSARSRVRAAAAPAKPADADPWAGLANG